MEGKVEVKPESLLNLDDLLQCPVCYEIPTGQIFQCNEGHHVCGRCKVRLDVCPVCRALFFGTRNYAMEELIANFRKLRAFKTGGKISAPVSGSSNSSTTNKDASSEEPENETGDEDIINNTADQNEARPPAACKGLFRCLCCKKGNAERLPSARLLNHLRYFHGPDLIEGRSGNGEYIQAWQFSTAPGRLVTAVRVADMGVFFLVIEMSIDSIYAWLMMAASPWVAHAFSYTVTLSGSDREAIFSDSVSSVKSCEGSLKKRGHCLTAMGMDARALMALPAISGKLSVRHTTPNQLPTQTLTRTVMRVANRGLRNNSLPFGNQLEPFLQDLQNDVARLSRAFATLGREANALVRSEAEIRARIENGNRENHTTSTGDSEDYDDLAPAQNAQTPVSNQPSNPLQPMSRNARRRMRQRLRAALNEPQALVEAPPVPTPRVHMQDASAANVSRQNGDLSTDYLIVHDQDIILPFIQLPSSSDPSNDRPANSSNRRANKKKRRQHR